MAQSDLYIGIIVHRYGYIPPDDNPDRKSITELEYEQAGICGITWLIFLLDDKASWPPDMISIRSWWTAYYVMHGRSPAIYLS